MKNSYIPVIGLEVHIELNTKSKMFCGCSADHFGKLPNSQVCPICLGFPGALPFANEEAINKTIKFGLALGCTISEFSKFYRKHYFYPDLPKGFQTSQLDSPLCVGGELKGKHLNHIHLEEDAGKLVHQDVDGKKVSLVDFNRSGVALMEIVTEPNFHDTQSIVDFLKEIQLIAKYLDISNADMEKGSMRLEANVSLWRETSRPEATKFFKFQIPNYKVELKNINSFKFLEKAINAEITRQNEILDSGVTPDQETRGYDEMKGLTYTQRGKADAHDYRYFPEADLPPMGITKSQISNLKSQIPELPKEKRERFKKEYGISFDFIDILVNDKSRADYFEEAIKIGQRGPLSAKMIADLMINKKMDSDFPEPAGLVKKIVELAKVDYADPDEVSEAVKNILTENDKAVRDYQRGNGNVIGFLIGMVQKKLKGQGNPQLVREEILRIIQKK